MVLGSTSSPKREEVTGTLRELHNKGFMIIFLVIIIQFN
jgi:hypothetical protein